ncbi:SPOR domain-containing protein [Sphingomonas sp. MMS12-HWE2-04]|uniref:SPOR domain-containing protein n=1 Tax=Sphingomonas sp. MMS12-HWE2-04 TaxID=3234199 RepID=UPI00384C1D69
MLASIVAGITIPADELEAVNNPVPVPAPVRVAETPRPVAPKPIAKPPVKSAVTEKPEDKPDPKKKAELAKADPKAKKPDPKKTDPKKPDPKKEAAKADPARIWVQVAGGANQASLPKAWKAVVAKAPAAFKGKSGWSTPLRATNRVLAGPFKTAAEAQTFVNGLTKAGLSGFVFTSDAGQKVTKLPN